MRARTVALVAAIVVGLHVLATWQSDRMMRRWVNDHTRLLRENWYRCRAGRP